ncbi:hypothetical protein GCM10010885_01450 [Alicyclobacillus cellulosilyticus]|uniref:DUF2953 family protein n=1 Tax=Alicyclobacillus cellulosilyticus TaxID=1003997 RepID=A0A917K2V9_9BACL|nr:hypothetical protein GCM10010885_01450 [Alicyclobacillus cellulosilyticus]
MLPVLCAATVFAVLFLFAVLIYHAPLRMTVSFRHVGHDDTGFVDIRGLGGLLHFRRTLTGLDLGFSSEGPSVKVARPPQAGRERQAHAHGETGGEPGGETGRPAGRAANRDAAYRRAASATALTAEEVWHVLRDISLVRRIWAVLCDVFRRLTVDELRLSLRVGTGDVVTSGVVCGTVWAVLSMLVGRWTGTSSFRQVPVLRVVPDYQRRVLEGEAHCILRIRLGHAIRATYRLVALWRRRKRDGAPDSGTDADRDVQHP